ncbi:MAG: penicillin-binding protein activator [Gammaproteobacteria bacterium]|jgi:outer membrane PBP1 activator LpoA protein
MLNKRNLQNLVTLLLVLLLTGCASRYKTFPPNHVSMSSTAEQYVHKASQTTGEDKQNYQILAVNQLISENNSRDSQQLLNQLNNSVSLNKKIDAQKKIVQAKFYLLRDRPKTALRKLHQITNPVVLPREVARSYYTTAAEAHLRNNNLAYNTFALISLNSLLDDQASRDKNADLIWRNLQTLSLDKLQLLLKRCNTTLLRGWISLAIIAHQDANNPAVLSKDIENWQQRYQQHPANDILPDQDKIANLAQVNPPKQVALLLPLHGGFAKMGQTVRDGFMTAYYANLKMLSSPPQIKVYDTSGADVVDLYQQAIQDGAQFVIGPLTKQNVAKLASCNKFTVPVVALNYLADNNFVDNLVQFGLSPKQSVQQVADAMWQHNINKVLIIVPQGNWGDKVQQTFVQKWQQLGGYIIAAINFSEKDNITDAIMSAFNIDQSKQRAQQLRNIIGKNIKFMPRRRQDINGIFLVATPEQARQIKPLLQFYYAGNLPIFSIANIYAGYNSSRDDRDLNKIYFDDMPWLLYKTPYINKLKQQIQAAWPNNLRANSRLYGLGVDAFTLSLLLPRLMILPNFALHGVTGQLYLNSNLQIYRQLSWAHFVAGTPRVSLNLCNS